MVHGQTVIHPLALIVTLIAGFCVILLPRKYAFIPLLLVGIFISLQQRIVIAGLDFTMLRILIMFAFARMFLQGEYALQLNTIDKTIIWWTLAGIVTYTLLWQTSGAFIRRLGNSFDTIGIYFFMRTQVQDWEDLERVLKAFILISLPLAAVMMFEWITSRNLFALFGGVPEITMIRDGRLRCQGAFQHPILAGSFGASLLPVALSFWWYREGHKFLALAGCTAATIITVTSSSSGPALSFLAGIFALCMWPFRDSMRIIRWGLAITLITLHFVMKAPVWALIARIAVFGSSTAYHRFNLIDQFIRRFQEWWLFGTRSTAEWDEFGKLWDVTNHYINVAVSGGLISIILFVTIIALCFRTIGRALRVNEDVNSKFFIWAIGASLFTHIVSFWGVSYFDQIIVLWYSLLSVIAAISSFTNQTFLDMLERLSEEDESYEPE